MEVASGERLLRAWVEASAQRGEIDDPSSLKLRRTGCRLPIADCRLPIADCRLLLGVLVLDGFPLLPWLFFRRPDKPSRLKIGAPFGGKARFLNPKSKIVIPQSSMKRCDGGGGCRGG
jgi:hypothetical protein